MTSRRPAGVVAAEGGFSLVEVMLALALTSVVALLAYTCMTMASAAAQQGEEQTGLINQVDFAWMLLQRDLQHALPGPVFQRQGPTGTGAATVGSELLQSGEQLGFSGGSQTEGAAGAVILRLVRDSSHDTLLPLAQRSRQTPRSGLQLVSYLWREGSLYRRHDAFVDGMQVENPAAFSEHPRQQLLLEGVEQMSLEFLPAGAEDLEPESWQQSWPAETTTSNPVPAAVSVQLTLAGMGQLTRLFVLPAGWAAL